MNKINNNIKISSNNAKVVAQGGAIFATSTLSIGDINGDFINNNIVATGNGDIKTNGKLRQNITKIVCITPSKILGMAVII